MLCCAYAEQQPEESTGQTILRDIAQTDEHVEANGEWLSEAMWGRMMLNCNSSVIRARMSQEAFHPRAMAREEVDQLKEAAETRNPVEASKRDRVSMGIIIKVVECEVNNYADGVVGGRHESFFPHVIMAIAR
jgi:hypothetical protein